MAQYHHIYLKTEHLLATSGASMGADSKNLIDGSVNGVYVGDAEQTFSANE